MEDFLKIFGLDNYDIIERNRLLLSLFCLLTFIILYYFYNLAKRNSQSRKENSAGLLALALAFLFYFLLGLFSANEAEESLLVLFSGAINVCILLSLGFFAVGTSKKDHLLTIGIWRYVSGLIIVIYLFQFFAKSPMPSRFNIDIIISIMSITFFGVYLVRNFIKKEMSFLGLVCGISIVIIAGLQFYSPDILGQGKFVHVNTAILAPALFLSIISVSITFNWINELSFKEVALIYSVDGNAGGPFEGKRKDQNAHKRALLQAISNDNIEDVIEEIVTHHKKRNKNLEVILILAARNSRNNTNRLKGITSEEDYNINRNRISSGVLELVNKM